MGRAFKPKKILQYIVFAVVVLLAYKYLFEDKQRDHFGEYKDHPRNLHQQKIKMLDPEEERGRERKPDAENNDDEDEKVENEDDENDKKEIEEERQNRFGDDLFMRKEKLKFNYKKNHEGKKIEKQEFLEDGIDWEVENEMKKRRKDFFEFIEGNWQSFEQNKTDYRDKHHGLDYEFPIVTAGSHSTFLATIEFIYSAQYFYPGSEIGVYDIGFTQEEKEFLETLCKTSVLSLFMEIWPDELFVIRHKIWRLMVLKFASANFGHFVYIDPGRYIFKQKIPEYTRSSDKYGILLGGRTERYSSFSVTNPHMFSFLQVDERKLQKAFHITFTTLIMHNTGKVWNNFIRYLTACMKDAYCVAPPGSNKHCDMKMTPKKWAHCHKYDESVVSVLLYRWFDYESSKFLVSDFFTKQASGKDYKHKVRVCAGRQDEF